MMSDESENDGMCIDSYENDIYYKKYKLLLDECAQLQKSNEILVFRIQEVNKIARRREKEVNFFKKRLIHNYSEDWTTIPNLDLVKEEEEANSKSVASLMLKDKIKEEKIEEPPEKPKPARKATKRKSKQSRGEKDPNAPKRPSNPFFQFCQEQRQILMEQLNAELKGRVDEGESVVCNGKDLKKKRFLTANADNDEITLSEDEPYPASDTSDDYVPSDIRTPSSSSDSDSEHSNFLGRASLWHHAKKNNKRRLSDLETDQEESEHSGIEQQRKQVKKTLFGESEQPGTSSATILSDKAVINESASSDGNQQATDEIDQQSERAPKRKEKIFPVVEKRSRKRPANPNNWKRRSAAIARQKGEGYINQKGVEIPKKLVNSGMLCECKRKCSEKIHLEQRKKLFSCYYKLDKNSQNVFLFKSMSKKSPARPRKNATHNKSATFSYSVIDDNRKSVLICKKAFCSIFQIGKKKVEYIQESLKIGAAAPSPDKRGKHRNRPHKLSDHVKQYVKDHINQFPAELSHYSRNNNLYKKYLSPTLNITKMYQLYREKCQEDNMPESYLVKYCSYARIFSTEFNLSFGHPRSDTCSTCDSGNSNEEHKLNYQAAFSSQRADRQYAKGNDGVVYVTMDLQQTLPLPRLTTSKAFYLRQMWMYNLGIHAISKDKEKAHFHTWTEDVAHRGSSEVSSSLLTFIEYNYLIPQNNPLSHLIMWTDSCAGQNKNFLIICLYQFLILKGIVKTIDHKFPEVGHSYLDSDRDFGRIEKRLRKHETIFLPEDYREIIGKSCKMNHVTDMALHFRNFNDLPANLNLINRKKNLLNETVPFRDGIKWIRVTEYGSYLYKENYDPNTPFKKVNIIRNSRTAAPNNVEIPRLGRKTGELSQEKINNLRAQLQFIREECQWYYEEIITEQQK